MKVAVIGANGQLGFDLCEAFGQQSHVVVKLNHDTFEVADLERAGDLLKSLQPDLVVNTAAMHNVEKCEADPIEAFRVNGEGARNLALLSNDIGFTLMHVSTDYVFDGAKGAPYIESDLPNPLNVYGNTKLSGELFIQNMADRFFVMRVSGLYGRQPCRAKGGLNFVSLMLKLAKERDEVRVVDDETLSPSYTVDVARQIVQLSNSTDYGLYHLTAKGSCTWYEFAAKIFDLSNSSVQLTVADPSEFPTKVNRPKYSVLENKALVSTGNDIMPHWSEGLRRYLENIHD